MQQRCDWAGRDPLMIAYHDQEWGVPLHDDRLLFEFLCLEGAQAGLSWSTVLKKRTAYRLAFQDFDPNLVACYDDAKVGELMQNKGLIRNNLKIRAMISNARQFLKLREEFNSFDAYIWRFVDHQPVQNRWPTVRAIPATSPESELMSKDLRNRGFKFVGPTICYALMQAVGMVNDHVVSCFRHRQLSQDR